MQCNLNPNLHPIKIPTHMILFPVHRFVVKFEEQLSRDFIPGVFKMMV